MLPVVPPSFWLTGQRLPAARAGDFLIYCRHIPQRGVRPVAVCLQPRRHIMSLSLLLLLFMLHTWGSLASHFLGTVMTYHPKGSLSDGSVTVVLRYKLNFHTCSQTGTWQCLSGDCGIVVSEVLNVVHSEGTGEWCQREGIMTRLVPSDAPFQLELNNFNWISNVQGILDWRAVTLVELRRRSDTGGANRSPQTTILPALRVPSNCRRDFHLLAFDPDGDLVKCRHGNASLSECDRCTPASVLSLSSSCSLSFSPTNSSGEFSYVVQLVMEDFPTQTITLAQANGTQTTKTSDDALSKLPLQFAFKVGPTVPSCTEGLYVPKFMPPTPANQARLFVSINQSLEITVSAQANASMISELLFSGPYNVNRTTVGPGQFILRWRPSDDQDSESHPICFVVQAFHNSEKLHSELRCVILTVGTATPETTAASNIVVGMTMKISSLAALSTDDIRSTLQQSLDQLGVAASITLKSVRLGATTTATPAGSTGSTMEG